mmetsp:Transcript_30420/g.36146  ORF Transcript_30420/g.36146 Transcript_30420/m.36146 type:complete len:87 (-) Transcript_30420:72-332(-)
MYSVYGSKYSLNSFWLDLLEDCTTQYPSLPLTHHHINSYINPSSPSPNLQIPILLPPKTYSFTIPSNFFPKTPASSLNSFTSFSNR